MSSTQMLKGILDGCLLALIAEEELYGYELATKLAAYGFCGYQRRDDLSVADADAKTRLDRSDATGLTERTKTKVLYRDAGPAATELAAFTTRWQQVIGKRSAYSKGGILNADLIFRIKFDF